jgi:hypothetical protein
MVEAAVWGCRANETKPAATAAAEPLDDPPGVRAAQKSGVAISASMPAYNVFRRLPCLSGLGAPASGHQCRAIETSVASYSAACSATVS